MAAEDLTTLYLRGVPRAVVREAKAAAARDGVTLGRWVADRLAEATARGTSTGRDADPRATDRREGDPLEGDMAWFEAHEPSLSKRYAGEYVAIVRRKVIDHDPDFDALAGRVFSKYGLGPICMPKVGRSEVRLASPRRARR